jgi:hypothetical protein
MDYVKIELFFLIIFIYFKVPKKYILLIIIYLHLRINIIRRGRFFYYF